VDGDEKDRSTVGFEAFAVLLVSGVAGAQTEGAVLDASSGSEGLPMSYADERGEKLVQTFVAEHSGYLTDVELDLDVLRSNSAEVKGTVQIISLPENGVPHQILAETTTSLVKSGPEAGTFEAPAYVEAGQTYGLAVLQGPNPEVLWRLSYGYAHGDLYYLSNEVLKGLALDNGPYDGVFSTYELPTPVVPATKEQCKNGGYKDFGFNNPGQCIKAVNAAN
jgi:hypothetical protein